jgi:hypothetical protein
MVPDGDAVDAAYVAIDGPLFYLPTEADVDAEAGVDSALGDAGATDASPEPCGGGGQRCCSAYVLNDAGTLIKEPECGPGFCCYVGIPGESGPGICAGACPV